jgi:hypothetical protein
VLGGRFQPGHADRYCGTHVISAGLHTAVGIARPGNPAREPLVIVKPDDGTVFVADLIVVACIVGISIIAVADAGSVIVAWIISLSINSDSDSDSEAHTHGFADGASDGLADGASHGLSHAYQHT